MSDIYLTKVERKTIFTQGLIYVLFTFVISDLTVTGPESFNYIPWLFFMGILGVNKFYHPVMTVIITTVTAFLSSLFKFNGLKLDTLYITLIAGFTTLFGIVVGLCIKEFVLEHRLVKHIKIQKKILYIVTIVVLTVFSFGIYALRFGNIVSYLFSRNKIQNYVKDTFNTSEFNITDYEYIAWSIDDYVYKIDTEGKKLELNVDKEVKLLNYHEIQQELNKELTENINLYVKNSNIQVEAKYEFNGITVVPSGLYLTVRTSALNDDEMSNLVENLEYLVQFKDVNSALITRVILNIDGVVQVIDKDDFNKITVQYLIDGMEMESTE